MNSDAVVKYRKISEQYQVEIVIHSLMSIMTDELRYVVNIIF